MDSDKTITPVNMAEQDPLSSCLLYLLQHYHLHYPKEALFASLPLVNNQLTPDLFVRAAERAQLKALVVSRPLHKIPALVLPAVLLLKSGQACILLKWRDKETAEVLLPELGMERVEKTKEELNENYSGRAIFVSPIFQAKSDEHLEIKTSNSSWFWGALKHYRQSYGEVMLAAFFINIFALVTPLFVMNVYDKVIPNAATITLWTLTSGVLIIFLFDLLLRFLRSYLIDIAGKKADIRIAGSLFQQVLTIQLEHKPSSVGAFASNLKEFENIRDFFTSATIVTLIDLPFVLLYLILIAYIGQYVVYVPLVIIPIILIAVFLIEKPLYRTVSEASRTGAQKHSIMVEGLTSIEDIKTLTAEGLWQRKWEQAVAANAQLGLKARFLSGSLGHISYFAQQLLTIGIVVVGVYEVMNHTLTLGGIIACSTLAGRIIAPLSQLVNLLSRFQQAKFALQSLNKLMELPNELTITSNTISRPTMQGAIEFQQVSAQYPGQEHSKALIDVSFKIKPGEKVAILGRIGSGKTTIQKLLLGLYAPKQGSIYIDGIDILQWHPMNLRKHIGYVPQDARLFAGSLHENIIMGCPTATDEQVLKAAKWSGVESFARKHPLGFAMPIGERGEGLSGGQRQTVAIARALLSDPAVLLFDEPTSSMDENLEREWIARMKEYFKNKTVFVITHKISLLSLVDRIMVMDSGKLVLDGPRDYVLQKITRPPAGT